jgi:hypothetical protein
MNKYRFSAPMATLDLDDESLASPFKAYDFGPSSLNRILGCKQRKVGCEKTGQQAWC